MSSWYRLLYSLLIIGLAGGCIGIRNPLPPDQSPIEAPPADGTLTTFFSDMITEDPVNYEITLPNPGGRFEAEPFRFTAQPTGLNIIGTATLHFKPEEPLDTYVKRFFNNLDVPPFEPIEGTDVQFSPTEGRHYYARPMTIDARDGWLMLEFRAEGRVSLVRYQPWFVQMISGAAVERGAQR